MEADDLCKQAERRMRGGFFSMFTGGPNLDEAADLYVQAANKLKLKKDWSGAADCYVKAAYAQERAGDVSRQANLLQEAGNSLKKVSPSEAARVYTKAADLYNAAGRFSQSAKMLKGIADTYEAENNLQQAMKFFKQAADYFEMDEYGKSSFTACILKYAELTAKLDNNYAEAIKIFEKEGEKALRNSMIQFGAKDHFLKAGILRLVQGDAVDMKIALEKYEEMDPRFSTSREGRLLRACVTAYEEQNEEAFVQAIQEYDSINRLDAWRVHFLYQAREALQLMSGEAPVQLSSLHETGDGEVDLS